ncbi:MAG: hypothetical protein ACRC1H_07670, partial [Caldilineaceae bacterium]
VTSVAGNFGAAGSFTRTAFGSPARIWWQTPTVICARYVDTLSSGLRIVTDITAFADRAQVECTVENSAVDTSVGGNVSAPSAVSYTGATITVNGTTVATVNASGAPEGEHAQFRAWYASAWVGGSACPRATMAVDYLQKHPLLFKVARANTADLSIYASDAYAVWGAGRHRASNMGGAGDHPSIGPLPQWEARALSSGDYRAWRAVEVNALSVLGFAINYRDTTTNLVPTFAQVGTRAYNNGASGWPMHAANGSLGWEVAHHPAAGLMAFLSRPSPAFIELAQKVALWNGTWSSSDNGGFTWQAGVHGYHYQVRGRAWCLRSQAHAAFLTPAGDAWRTSALAALAANVTYLDQWRTDSKFNLGVMCDQSPGSPMDHDSGVAGFQQSVWQH